RHRNDRERFAIREMQLVQSRIVRASAIRIVGPVVEEVSSLAADDVVVALSAEDDIDVVRRTVGRTVAPKEIVSAVSVNDVGAESAVNQIATVRTVDDVVARSAVDHADPIATAIVQGGNIERMTTGDEADHVVAPKAVNPDLLDERIPFVILPSHKMDAAT